MTIKKDVKVDRAVAVETVRAAAAEVALGGLPFVTTIVPAKGGVLAPTSNRVGEEADSTVHAEVAAIRDAFARLGLDSIRGGALYTSCSPCTPCYDPAFYAGIDITFYTVTREEAGSFGSNLRGTYTHFPHETEGWGPKTTFIDLDDRLYPFVEWTS